MRIRPPWISLLTRGYTVLINLFTRALTDHLPSDAPIVVTAANPGYCVTDLLRDVSKDQFDPTLPEPRTAEQGSRQLIFAAVGPNVKNEEEAQMLKGGYVSEASLKSQIGWVNSEEGPVVRESIWVSGAPDFCKVL